MGCLESCLFELSSFVLSLLSQRSPSYFYIIGFAQNNTNGYTNYLTRQYSIDIFRNNSYFLENASHNLTVFFTTLAFLTAKFSLY